MEKYTGIKKAVGDARDWEKLDNRHVVNIMVDLDTKKVWADCFANCNSFKDYSKQDNIYSISVAIAKYLSTNIATMDNIKLAIDCIVINL